MATNENMKSLFFSPIIKFFVFSLTIVWAFSCSEKQTFNNDEIRAKEYFSLGKEYSSKQDYSLAAEMYELAAETVPKDFYYYNAGVARQSAFAYGLAIQHYKSALKLNKNFSEAYYNIALCYEKEGNIDAAKDFYNQYQDNINSEKK